MQILHQNFPDLEVGQQLSEYAVFQEFQFAYGNFKAASVTDLLWCDSLLPQKTSCYSRLHASLGHAKLGELEQRTYGCM